MKRIKPNGLLSHAFAAIMLLGLIAVTAAPAIAELDKRDFDPPKAVTGFALSDHKKKPFGPERFKGTWTLMVLGYTHCPDVCPFTLTNLALVTEQLKFQLPPDSIPQVVFVGVDPDRDAEVLPDYMPHFDPDFLGVTGDWPEVKKLVEALDGFVRSDKKGKDDEGYLVRHSSRISVINPNGKIVSQINPPLPPNEAAIFISSLMRKHNKANASVGQ